MSDKEDLTRPLRRSSTAVRLKELVGLSQVENSPQTGESANLASRPLIHSPAERLVENELMRMLQNQDTIINLLFHELQGCKSALRLLKEENFVATEDSRRLYEELKGHVVKLVLQRKKSDDLSLPQQHSISTDLPAERSGNNSHQCDNCRKLSEELADKNRNLQTMMEKLHNTVQLCEEAVRDRNLMEQKAQDSQLREQKLSTELNSATSRLRQIEMNILKQEPMENYKAKIDLLMSSETELKENLRNLAENNQDLKRQLQAFRSELVEREMDLHKNVREMQDALNQAVRNKLEMDELCSRLKLKLEGVNELSKMKISNLDKKYVETTVKLEQTTQDLQRDRNEYLKLIEKSSWLEKQLWQEKQERLKLVGEKEVLSEKRNIDVTKALRIAEENYEKNRAYLSAALASQTNLVEKLMSHCRFLTDRIDSMVKEHRREIQLLRRRK